MFIINSRKKFKVFLALLFVVLPISLVSAQSVTVIQMGLGISVTEATRNATENALVAVAGSFIDSETLLQKRKEIKNGIKTITKSMDTKISEFSQGFVEKVEILDTIENNGLFQVEAAVTVEKKSFEPFIKKITVGERKIKKGLLSSLATNQSQAEEFDELLVEKIINPILTGEVISITVGEIQQLTSPMASNEINKRRAELKRKFGKDENILGIKFKVSLELKKGFLENYKSIIQKMSKSNITPFTCGPAEANHLYVFWSKDLVWNDHYLQENSHYWSEFSDDYYKVDSLNRPYRKMWDAQGTNCKEKLPVLGEYSHNSESFDGYIVDIKNGSKIGDYLNTTTNITNRGSYEIRFLDENDNKIFSEIVDYRVGDMYGTSPHFSIGSTSVIIDGMVEGRFMNQKGVLLRISENFEFNLIAYIPEEILANSDRIEVAINPQMIKRD